MAVKIRLRRMGKKKQPIYKVVAADARSPRDGKILEAIGLYNPLTKPHTINIDENRALYWLGVGAQPTDTVKSLLTQKGIWLKRELMGRGLTEEQIEAEMNNWAKMREAKLKSSSTKKKKSKKAIAKQSEAKKADTDAAPGSEAKPDVYAKPEVKADDVESKKDENVVAEKPEIKDNKSDESTAEVKGTTSEEKTEG
ncbi:MAG: 30S ribosomal protein S16 [Ignavibacteriales bacterium CG12_big_fil_rev_8_21_14_0_65_30_8]|nr:MAG: 30S ribosomal protein S16 [Ignavibacteriales bacterium CG12_big_fil_rev_8_21_14_0_65_30_8]